MFLSQTRNTFCRTRSLPNATFSFLIMWRSFSAISAAVYKISWQSDDFFTEMWWYIDFQNGGRPPSWNCFTTIRDHPQSLCCWPQLPLKFHVTLIHRSEDIAIWIFRIFGLKSLFRPLKWGFGGTFKLWTHKYDYSSSRPPKGTSLRKSASFKLSSVKIRRRVHSVTDVHTYTHRHTHR